MRNDRPSSHTSDGGGGDSSRGAPLYRSADGRNRANRIDIPKEVLLKLQAHCGQGVLMCCS